MIAGTIRAFVTIRALVLLQPPTANGEGQQYFGRLLVRLLAKRQSLASGLVVGFTRIRDCGPALTDMFRLNV